MLFFFYADFGVVDLVSEFGAYPHSYFKKYIQAVLPV